MPVDAPQVAPAQGHAMAVEELEDLDRDLAAVVDPVAKLGGGEGAARDRFREVGDDAVISRTVERRKKWSCADLVDPAHAGGALEQRPDLRLGAAGRLARSRTRGGRKRSAPPSIGAIVVHAASSRRRQADRMRRQADERRRREQARRARASLCSAASNAGFGSLGCSAIRSASRPTP